MVFSALLLKNLFFDVIEASGLTGAKPLEIGVEPAIVCGPSVLLHGEAVAFSYARDECVNHVSQTVLECGLFRVIFVVDAIVQVVALKENLSQQVIDIFVRGTLT